ncbi:hypothetical protein GWI33_016867 [Rhynchophorus ferrugineus]|uniref:Uncharacterized protein n=1 Tax=Rhynchophorus ferrugineus TaxID=354439 RepID=A0A834M4K0_RHYFE|nr:hypothetical protein GWI33_016867 [Rhynchophorus ferrugineus]
MLSAPEKSQTTKRDEYNKHFQSVPGLMMHVPGVKCDSFVSNVQPLRLNCLYRGNAHAWSWLLFLVFAIMPSGLMLFRSRFLDCSVQAAEKLLGKRERVNSENLRRSPARKCTGTNALSTLHYFHSSAKKQTPNPSESDSVQNASPSSLPLRSTVKTGTFRPYRPTFYCGFLFLHSSRPRKPSGSVPSSSTLISFEAGLAKKS